MTWPKENWAYKAKMLNPMEHLTRIDHEGLLCIPWLKVYLNFKIPKNAYDRLGLNPYKLLRSSILTVGNMNFKLICGNSWGGGKLN